MRNHVRLFVQMAAQRLGLQGPCYEFGSYQEAASGADSDLRPLFPGQEYIGCDLRPGPGVDRLEDLTALRLPDQVARTVLCLDTLEHVWDPVRAVEQMMRVLAPGGVLLLSVPMDFPIHAFPDDYWRMTPSCLARLLAPLDASLIGSVGWEKHPHTVLALGWKAPLPAELPEHVANLLAQYRQGLKQLASSGGRWKRWRRRLLRPLWPKDRRLREKHYWHTAFAFHLRHVSAPASHTLQQLAEA